MSVYFLKVRKNATILRNNLTLMFKFGVDCIFTSWWKNKLFQHMTKVKDNIYNSTKMYKHIMSVYNSYCIVLSMSYILTSFNLENNRDLFKSHITH